MHLSFDRKILLLLRFPHLFWWRYYSQAKFALLFWYFAFFSPTLCQRALDLIMAPRVVRWTVFSICNFLNFNSLFIVVLLVSDKSFSFSFLYRVIITVSRLVSVKFILPVLCFACCIDFERISIFIVSQRSMASSSVLFWYSFATSLIVVFIKLIYSLSDRKDVFNFQKPRPLGLISRTLRSEIFATPWPKAHHCACVFGVVTTSADGEAGRSASLKAPWTMGALETPKDKASSKKVSFCEILLLFVSQTLLLIRFPYSLG